LLFLEIDGLAHDVLVRAMRDGNAPTMARWLRSGSHRLARWETDWSSQTGACQAGLLHGDNDDMPAFRWWEKDRDAAIVTNHPKDAMELERRHSNGRGLLFSDGASRANILSGDAPHSLLTMSTVMKRDRPGRIGQDYFAYFANPYNLIRTITLVATEVVSELASAAQQRRLDVQPRIKRGFVYSLMRAWATVIQRDLQVSAVIADMYAGRPVTYTTFLAYDEVAHHSGIERPETLLTLRRCDRQVARIAAAAGNAPRPYRLVVLSDHGQSQGATFLDRYGISLEELVREAAGTDDAVAAGSHPDEALGYLGASLTEASGNESVAARAVGRVTRATGSTARSGSARGTTTAATTATAGTAKLPRRRPSSSSWPRAAWA
jgi:predicted AlkP superfamily pyrophosphatase or phosphodiesterase